LDLIDGYAKLMRLAVTRGILRLAQNTGHLDLTKASSDGENFLTLNTEENPSVTTNQRYRA
jgi:hypothetical protein